LLVSSLQSGKAWQECTQQTKKNHFYTNSAVSRQVYLRALLVQHLQQGSPTFLKLRATSCVPINARSYQFDTHF